MTAFVITMAILFVIEAAISMTLLSEDIYPQRTKASVVINLFSNAGLATWAIWLLVKGGAA